MEKSNNYFYVYQNEILLAVFTEKADAISYQKSKKGKIKIKSNGLIKEKMFYVINGKGKYIAVFKEKADAIFYRKCRINELSKNSCNIHCKAKGIENDLEFYKKKKKTYSGKIRIEFL